MSARAGPPANVATNIHGEHTANRAGEDGVGLEVITAGRTDVEDYFRLSGIREFKRLSHSPFLVFVEDEDRVEVKIVDSAATLLTYPDHTKVMGQWRGEWRSDFFQFTVGQFRTYTKEHPKQAHHVV
jgi:hypothetical protein